MKRLTVILAIVVLVAAVVLGVQISQKNTVTAERDTALEQAATLTTDLEAARKTAEDVQAQLAAADTEKATAQEELATAQKTAEGLQTKLTELEKAKTGAETALEDATKTAQEAQDKVALLEAEKQEMDKVLLSQKTTAAGAVAQVNGLLKERGSLTAQLAASKKVEEEMSSKVAELEKQKADLTAQLAASKKAGEETAAKVTELEKQKAEDQPAGQGIVGTWGSDELNENIGLPALEEEFGQKVNNVLLVFSEEGTVEMLLDGTNLKQFVLASGQRQGLSQTELDTLMAEVPVLRYNINGDQLKIDVTMGEITNEEINPFTVDGDTLTLVFFDAGQVTLKRVK